MHKQAKFHLQTFGCQMNHNDSERIVALLQKNGLVETKNAKEADVLLVNTCSIRQSAEDRVFGFIHNWKKWRLDNPDLIIGITGCMPGRDKDGKINRRLPGVDLFFPIAELPLLPKRLREVNPKLFADFEQVDNLNNDYFAIDPARTQSHRASIAIQTGCNNFCTYCVVPHSRGREKNRAVKDIIAEVKKAVAGGAKEIFLLGQVINNYKAKDFLDKNPFKDKDDFAALLWEVDQIDGVERMRWIAADPQYFNQYQIQALSLPKQANYLHLPVQSGDNSVLKKMNRHYTREDYIDLIKKIRQSRPDIAIGTDIVVGFCGETDEQFANTFDLYKQCDFDIAYLAQYSERSGTTAAKAFKDDVPKETKKKRWQDLQDLMEEIVEKKNKKYLGKEIKILVDKCEGGVCSGSSSEMKYCEFLGEKDLIGKMVSAKVLVPEMWRLKCEKI